MCHCFCSAPQEEDDGGGAAAEQDGDDATEQPAAGGRAETSGAVAGGRGLEGKSDSSSTSSFQLNTSTSQSSGCLHPCLTTLS